MLDNAKYGNKSILPELRVIDGGKLKGFVIINPRWAGFQGEEYLLAAQSVRQRDNSAEYHEIGTSGGFHVETGDFDLRDFEIIRSLEKQEDVKDCEKKKVKRK